MLMAISMILFSPRISADEIGSLLMRSDRPKMGDGRVSSDGSWLRIATWYPVMDHGVTMTELTAVDVPAASLVVKVLTSRVR